jgi:hypothetical protein
MTDTAMSLDKRIAVIGSRHVIEQAYPRPATLNHQSGASL